MLNNTVEISVMELWDLRARAELPESRRPALDFLQKLHPEFFSGGLAINNIAEAIALHLDQSDQSSTDAILASMNHLCIAGWIIQSDERLHPSNPNDTPPVAYSAPLGRNRSRNPISPRTRLRVHAADDWICWLCEFPTAEVESDLPDHEDWDAVIDHVKPHSHGGSNRFENLRTAHRWCNITRGSRPRPNVIVQKLRVMVRGIFQHHTGAGR